MLISRLQLAAMRQKHAEFEHEMRERSPAEMRERGKIEAEGAALRAEH